MTPDEARARFASSPVARLASVGPDGRPHLVPITFALDGDRIVTAIDAKPKREAPIRRVANIRSNPLVSVLVDEYESDWARLWWVRADGQARIVEDHEGLARVRQLLWRRYPQYESVDLDGPAIVVTVDRWVGWSASTGAGRSAPDQHPQ